VLQKVPKGIAQEPGNIAARIWQTTNTIKQLKTILRNAQQDVRELELKDLATKKAAAEEKAARELELQQAAGAAH